MRTKIFLTTLLLFVGLISNAQKESGTSNNKTKENTGSKETSSQVGDNSSGSDNNYNGNTKLVNITNELYFLQGDQENMGVFLAKDGVFLIDTQNDEEMSRNLRTINRLSKKKPINYLVNTSSKVRNLKTYGNLKKDGTIILSHEPKLNKEDNYKLKNSTSSISNITFSNEITFNYGNEKIKVFPINNSGNSLVYFTKRNVLFSGDAFIVKKYPLLDSENGIGNSARNIIDVLDNIINIADENTKIIPGKEGIAKLQDVIVANNMITAIYKKLYTQIITGKNLEQVLAMNSITRKYDDKGYGNGSVTTEMFVTSFYNEIKKELDQVDTRTQEEKVAAKLKEVQKEKEKNKN